MCVCAKMKCDVCGLDYPIQYKCKDCGKGFCFYCGDISDRRCIQCVTELVGEVFDREYWVKNVVRSRSLEVTSLSRG